MQANLILGDCLEKMKGLQENSVDLVITSPPYADRRKKQYGGVQASEYIEWFKPIAEEIKRVLKPSGSFILNIKEHVENGERSDYVLRLVLAMRERGWLWTEEWMWHKKNAMPGKWPNRFRDGFERIFQFNKEKKFAMYQEAVMIPMGDWAKTRLKNLSDRDKRRAPSQTQSGFSKNTSNWVGKEMVYPDNVLWVSSVATNVGHPAPFPLEIPEFFIKLFTTEGDVVLDPFMGSGTTGIACKKLNRNFTGIELSEDYYKLSQNRIGEIQARLNLGFTETTELS